MTIAPEQALRAFAGKRRLRVQPCWVVYLHPGDPALYAIGFRFGSRKYRLLASTARVILTAKLEIPVFFSAGAPGTALITTSPVDVGRDDGQPIYASPGFEPAVRAWMARSLAMERILALRLREGESLHAARNETMLVVLPDRDLEATFETFAATLDAFGEYATSDAAAPAPLLPEGFADLEAIAAHWTLADDREREETLSHAGPAVRRRLRTALVPRLKDIDRYLDQQSQPLSEAAIRLQTLGELGAELARENG